MFDNPVTARQVEGDAEDLVARQGKRSIGTAAEDVVVSWFSAQGIPATRPKEDERGWDLMVQLPADDVGEASADQSVGGITILLQVKATSSKRGRCSIKLDNWATGAKDVLPWAFVVLEYDAEPVEGPSRAYFVPMDDALTLRVLKRLRKLTREEANTVHKKSMSLSWGNEHRLAAPFATELAAAIRSFVGDPLAYCRAKAACIQHGGFDKDRFKLSFSLPLRAGVFEEVAEFAVGLRDELPVSFTGMQEARFGIWKDVSDEDLGGSGRLLSPSFEPSLARLEIALRDDTATVTADAEVRDARSVFPFLPPESSRVRVDIPFLTLVLAPNGVEFRFERPGETPGPVPLCELVRAANAFRILEDKSRTGLRICLSLDGRPPRKWSLDPGSHPVDASSQKQEWQAAIAASVVAAQCGLDPAVPVRPDDVVAYGPELRALCSLMETTSAIEFPVADTQGVQTGHVMTLFSAFCAPVGGFVCVAVVRMTGTVLPAPTGGESRICRADDVRVAKTWIVRRDEFGNFDGHARVEALADDAEERGLQNVFFDAPKSLRPA